MSGVICEVCGINGPKDTWFKYPSNNIYGQLINRRCGNRVVIGHRQQKFYFPNRYGHVGVYNTLCNNCHNIAPKLPNELIFKTREEIHEHIEKQFKYRVLAKNTVSITENTTIPLSIILYSHYDFTKGLIVKIPGSDNHQTKNDIYRYSSFKYVMVTKAYPKGIIPEWATAGSGISSVIDFDYYVEVIPYKVAKQNACKTIIKWWIRVRATSKDQSRLQQELETLQHKLGKELPEEVAEIELEISKLMERKKKVLEETNKNKKNKERIEAILTRIKE